jgi:hypothetical protein
MRNIVRALTAILVLATAPAAAASGPSLGTLEGGLGITPAGGTVRFVALPHGSSTVVAAVRTRGGYVLRSRLLSGAWGVPVVTVQGRADGLSRDARLLVLAQATPSKTVLRSQTQFLLLATNTLLPARAIRLHGDFAFDALAPGGHTLYLIQHVSTADVTSYRVRAYDLETDRLVPGAIADKRQAGWTMSGYPVARATSRDGRWVYTVYRRDGGYPFVHALDSVNRSAVCIGLPWPAWKSQDAFFRAVVRFDGAGRKLTIAAGTAPDTRFVLDTRTLRITRPQRHGSLAAFPPAAFAAAGILAVAGAALRRRIFAIVRRRARPA